MGVSLPTLCYSTRARKLGTLEVDKTKKLAYISEPLCIGCGICVKRCPFEAPGEKGRGKQKREVLRRKAQ